MEPDDEDMAAAIAMSMAHASPSPAPGAQVASEGSPMDSAIAELRRNSTAVLADAGTLQVLETLLKNLAKAPGEEKFRKVRLANAKIAKALSCNGAEALLLAVGFVRAGEELLVPGERAAAELGDAAKAGLDALAMFGGYALSAQLRAEGPVRCVCAMPGGGLASGSMDNVVRVYNPGCWDAPRLLSGHKRRAGVDGVLALLPGPVGPDAADLVSAGRDGNIILWKDGAEQATLSGHGVGVDGTNVHVVSSLGRRADGALLSGGWDKTVRAWQGENQVAKMEGHSIAVNAVVGLSSGEVVSGSGDQSIGVWQADGQQLRSLTVGAPVRTLCSCGGTLLASGANDGTVRLWDTATGHQKAQHKVADSYVLSLAYCASTGELAAGADDGTLAVLAVEGGSTLRLVQTLQHCAEAYGVAFLESGDLAVACGDSTCVLWTRSPAQIAAAALREDYNARVNALLVARGASATASTGTLAPGAGGNWDYSFPVELGGRKMSLQWNRGDDPQAIAARFTAANDLDPRHSGDVVTFVMQTMQQVATGGGAAAGGGAGGGAKDFTYPVEVADGRRLNISWNRGDDPQAVALAFARQHGGIGADELPDIVQFIQQVSGGPPTFTQQAPAPAAPSPAMQQQAMLQVMEMGFDEATARGALQAAGWSVEAAVMRLLG
mmetsp:Transcript_36491/g.100496  ORF Transcript_36491/g.100496 Transcript_36491/m.100496 type:complete len:665 (-) Transcript_36491:26-2020(-)